MNFIDLSKKRFTVRKFSETAVEKEKLDKMLEAGNTAPTAKNNQPQRIMFYRAKRHWINSIHSLRADTAQELYYFLPTMLMRSGRIRKKRVYTPALKM